MQLESHVEQFHALSALAGCRHAFIKRIPGIDVFHDKDEALRRLDSVHRQVRDSLGMESWPVLTAQQVHGDRIARIEEAPPSDRHFAGYDGFMTNQRQVVLGVYVADCCAVYLVDPKTPAIALVHSGKKGTALHIASQAIEQLREKYGTDPANLVVQLSPCIRPPHYEIDFAADIREQCRARGVTQIHDAGVCTACDLGSYYSYRAEKGKTGRMLALLALA